MYHAFYNYDVTHRGQATKPSWSLDQLQQIGKPLSYVYIAMKCW